MSGCSFTTYPATKIPLPEGEGLSSKIILVFPSLKASSCRRFSADLLFGLIDLVLRDGELPISGQNLVEAELRGAADDIHGPLGVGDAGNVHGDLVLALDLDLRLRDAKAVHALPDDLYRLLHLLAGDLAAVGLVALELHADPPSRSSPNCVDSVHGCLMKIR